MSRLEYLLARSVLRLVWLATAWLRPSRRRVVLATARSSVLEGNLAHIDAALRRRDPSLEIVHLLHPYGYGWLAKARYLLRLIGSMVQLRRAGLFVIDNAYLPVHVAPDHPGTTVVQVWHAASALKRFGRDVPPSTAAESRYLHRGYDHVVASSEFAREPYARAFGIAPERIVPTGLPRADVFHDPAAMAAARDRVLARYPALRDRVVVLYAPTFRGRGAARTSGHTLDAVRLRERLPEDHVLVLKGHPNLDPARYPTAGYDLVADHRTPLNDLFAVTAILVTDYSSSIFEYALLRRPLVLLVPDLEAYERQPGLYLDYRTEMIGVQVRDTDGVAAAIATGAIDVDPAAYDAFITRHMGAADGRASERFVDRFLGAGPSGLAPS